MKHKDWESYELEMGTRMMNFVSQHLTMKLGYLIRSITMSWSQHNTEDTWIYHISYTIYHYLNYLHKICRDFTQPRFFPSRGLPSPYWGCGGGEFHLVFLCFGLRFYLWVSWSPTNRWKWGGVWMSLVTEELSCFGWYLDAKNNM